MPTTFYDEPVEECDGFKTKRISVHELQRADYVFLAPDVDLETEATGDDLPPLLVGTFEANPVLWQFAGFVSDPDGHEADDDEVVVLRFDAGDDDMSVLDIPVLPTAMVRLLLPNQDHPRWDLAPLPEEEEN